MDLESKLGDAQNEIRAPVKLSSSKDKTSWIPRPPARCAPACSPRGDFSTVGGEHYSPYPPFPYT